MSLYPEETLKILTFRIKHIPHLSEASIVRFVRNAYIAVGTAGILAVLLGLLTFFVPRAATAEWLFSGARAAEGEAILHDPTVDLLEAAVNSDPNPNKGEAPITLSEGEALVPGSSVVSESEIAEEKAEQEAAEAEKEAATKAAAAKKKAAAEKAKAKTASKAAASAKLPAVSGYFGNPLPGGRRSQGLHGHNAVDISAPPGTPIYAAASGTVTTAKSGSGWNSGYGNYVVVSHPNGTSTLYAHMSRVAVPGGPVSKGSVIGYVGMTGEATGNHLHFEVRGAKNPLTN